MQIPEARPIHHLGTRSKSDISSKLHNAWSFSLFSN